MKKAQVIWSDQALVNLETIFDFLEEKSPTAAQRIIEELIGRQINWNPFRNQDLYSKT